MKPRPSAIHPRPPRSQLSLPLEAPTIVALNAPGRAAVIAGLARLLLEATGSPREREGADDRS